MHSLFRTRVKQSTDTVFATVVGLKVHVLECNT